MKAVLEFSYPDDENKLRRALHAEDAFNTLHAIFDELQVGRDMGCIAKLVEECLGRTGEIA
jgi:hypothetical protein